MCIIAIKPAGAKMMSDQTITIMFINNPDGAGYMYYDKDSKSVVIKKGFMSVKALTDSLNSHDLTDTNVVLHFRIGTSGLNDALNCHPYPLFGNNALKCKTDIGMAHNGILTKYIPPKTSKINDTQLFIGEVLNKLDKRFLNDPDKLMLIKALIGTNKLAFLDNKNKLTLIGDFIHDGDYIYSNHSYEYTSLYPSVKNTHLRGTEIPKSKKTAKSHKIPTKSTNVSPKKEDTCVTTRYKLTDDDYDFWKDEPSDFWDDWDRRHPTIR